MDRPCGRDPEADLLAGETVEPDRDAVRADRPRALDAVVDLGRLVARSMQHPVDDDLRRLDIDKVQHLQLALLPPGIGRVAVGSGPAHLVPVVYVKAVREDDGPLT